jgi:DNA polymerase-3 subunit delta'
MVVGPDGLLPLPWLQPTMQQALAGQRGHALLIHGAAGSGALAFAATWAQAWLCEAGPQTSSDALGGPSVPCGRCASCRLVQARVHPDLVLLMPELLRRQHEWPLAGDSPERDDAKRKPSRQIRIDEIRQLTEWATRTSGRGRGKVAVLHPAEALNAQAANALLKTLEEPPPGTRLVLSCADPALLLPTVLSRCQRVRLPDPPTEIALDWLRSQGLAEPQTLLAACAGRPLDALALMQAGIDAAAWARLPGQVARGQSGHFSGWPMPRVVDALLKLCHDAMSVARGGGARYFPSDAMPHSDQPEALTAWAKELARVARHDEHPWNEGLLVDALVTGGARALALKGGNTPRRASQIVTLPE